MSLIPLAYMCMYSDLLKGFGGFSSCVYWQDVPLDTGGGRSYCLIVPLWRLCDVEVAASANLHRRLRSQRTQLKVQLITGYHNIESRD